MKMKLTQPNANNFVNYWEKYKTESGVYIEFIDFDEIEISTDDIEYTPEEAVEFVRNVYYNVYN